jgi:hypothetical protein
MLNCNKVYKQATALGSMKKRVDGFNGYFCSGLLYNLDLFYSNSPNGEGLKGIRMVSF